MLCSTLFDTIQLAGYSRDSNSTILVLHSLLLSYRMHYTADALLALIDLSMCFLVFESCTLHFLHS
ncbi:hypothetical protein M501DRAFT_432815 [Patellaria atrata CBS 101060]|uniref:Uncharacterized protein n=1 Tax=Patellaria atrata CBS 101060 TaxID=1346257 RepID=A0A9P4VLE7_9PEZI|nr:hypothetical protein M501DRAFT_432815 [Patellaria atrata CBS 101060]